MPASMRALFPSLLAVMLWGCAPDSRPMNLSGNVSNDAERRHSGDYRLIRTPIDELGDQYQDILIRIDVPANLTRSQRAAFIDGFCDYHSNRLGLPVFIGSEAERAECVKGYMDGLAAAKASFDAMSTYFDAYMEGE
jgi:hypothetical protein